MAFAATFEISNKLFVLTKIPPPGATRPLQGYALAGAVGADNVTYYLVADEHGGNPPKWVAETDVVRAEVRNDDVYAGSASPPVSEAASSVPQ